MERGSETILVILVIIALVLTAINAFVALRQVSDIARVTGFVSTTGQVNISIPSQANIRLNISLIDWQNGTVNRALFDSANLSTSRPLGSKVVGGTWTETCEFVNPSVGCNTIGVSRKPGIDNGTLIMNVGNVNLSLQIQSDKNAQQYLCGAVPCGQGTTPSPKFRWNVTEFELGSCGGAVNINASVRGIFNETTTTSPGTYICGNASTGGPCSATGCKLFQPADPIPDDGLGGGIKANTIRVDFYIEVPEDVPPGNKTATITFTGTE